MFHRNVFDSVLLFLPGATFAQAVFSGGIACARRQDALVFCAVLRRDNVHGIFA